MGDNPLESSPLGPAFRAAHQALLALAPPGTPAAAEDSYLPIIVDELEELVAHARDTAAANFGPTFGWERPTPIHDKWAPVVLQLDFDTYADEYPPGVSRIRNWDKSALALAARAYRRECQWDHSPGEAGIWLLCVMPFQSMGSSWVGSLAGFVIIHDRDADGRYESLAHLWTAEAGDGVASGRPSSKKLVLASHWASSKAPPLTPGFDCFELAPPTY